MSSKLIVYFNLCEITLSFLLDNSDWTASMDYDILKSYVGNCSEYKGDYYLVIEDYEKAVEAYTYAESYYEKWPFQLTKMLNNKSLALLGLKEFKEASMINYNVINLSKKMTLRVRKSSSN